MSEFILEAKTRDKLRKEASKKYRKAGYIPAVMYGQGDNKNILIENKAFSKMAAKLSRASVIQINLDGKSYNALIRDYDKDYLKGNFAHVDFYELKNGKSLKVTIPLNFIGTPIGIRNFGVFEIQRTSVEVECIPENIVPKFDVDVSGLDLNHSFHIKDLKVDLTKYKIITHNEEVVALVSPSTE